ncbi:MAG: hypothetical protein C5B55_14135 [Blastocatellia bacterium]|nr:MAG: hypothetical protein C5B55_14135 [Blastocatellia bacterium]
MLTTLFPTTFAKEPAASLTRKAVSVDPVESTTAIAELRSLGPAGLESMRQQFAEEIERRIANPTMSTTPEWDRISRALDQVAQQKDSYLSGLYWYTDLREAQAASSQSGKPILSLRLLGKLTDELSCANSRFFRTVLYSNKEVSQVLREHFVLHWQTVRPVPLITIDFGDGRKIERTITGNSIHYFLDSEGNPLDGFPGVYGPQAFLKNLAQAESVFKLLNGKNEIERRTTLAKYYRGRINEISLRWLNDTTKLGGKVPEGFQVERNENGEALSIMPLAVSKAVTEGSMLRAMVSGSEALGRITDQAGWTSIAAMHASSAALDEWSVSLMRRQNSNLAEESFKRLVANFEKSVALDTVRNEYMLHTKLYAFLVADRGRSDVDKLNEKVYAELFLTPRSDPWLGLLAPETYTGIANGGAK